MPERHRHKVGDYLAVCDESGIVGYASEMVKRWDGSFVRQMAYETRHPQEFVKAVSDPKALTLVRTQTVLASASPTQPNTIGTTSVVTPTGPASHLFGR
jgi:hypothetical protein